MAVEHPLAGAARVSLADLEAQPLVDFPAGSGARRQTDEAFAAAGVRHRVQFEVTNIRLMEKFAKRGLAVGLVPARIARCFNGVVSVAVEDAPVRHVYAIWSTHPTPAAKAFVQLIEQRLAGRDSH
ncbi:aminoethylphosphonate catabolism associated LysR family transcriptional regulator [compost metagenome]